MATHSLLVSLIVASAVFACLVHGQFFTKTSKSVPRLGRRGGTSMLSLPVQREEVSGGVDRFFQKYDANGDWCLSQEEMLATPFARQWTASRVTQDRSNQEGDVALQRLLSSVDEK